MAAIAVLAGPRAVRMLTRSPDTSAQAAAAARGAAAAWIAAWVSRSATISCDPLMCAVLRAHRVPAERLARIGLDTPDPEGSDVVVATEAIRQRFGRRLASVYAPAVLASFGTGPARVAVRVVPSAGGAGRYLRSLRADERARRTEGRELLANPGVSEPESAARQLAAGLVDSRILMDLAVMAHRCRLAVLGFAGAGPGASPGMPLLSVDVTAGRSPNGVTAASAGDARVRTTLSLAPLLGFLRAQIPPLQPASFRELTAPDGTPFLRIRFAAPAVIPLTQGYSRQHERLGKRVRPLRR